MINKIEPLVYVITGPMYSGKTSRMVSLVIDHKYAGCKYQFFKAKRDNRYSKTRIITNNGTIDVPAHNSKNSKELERLLSSDTDVIGIDEVQFFDSGIIDLIVKLRKSGKIVYATGLDMCHNMKPAPFIEGEKHIGELFAVADVVEKKTAFCQEKVDGKICGAIARYTKKIGGEKGKLVEVGGKDIYIATCLEHHRY